MFLSGCITALVTPFKGARLDVVKADPLVDAALPFPGQDVGIVKPGGAGLARAGRLRAVDRPRLGARAADRRPRRPLR